MSFRNLSRLALAFAFMAGLVLPLQAAISATPVTASARRHRKKVRTVRPAGVAPVVRTSGTRVVRRTTTRAAVLRSDASTSMKVATARRRRGRRVFFNPWTEPTYADSTVGDTIEGEDLVVRRAAVDGLGPYNGTVVVSDPSTGRILSIVNQKLALKGAFQPCSTVKVMVSLASLNEGIVNADVPVGLTRRTSMDMTKALATSNNLYFARLGQELGFERVERYAKLFGLGEKAGLEIPGEEPGFLTDEPPQSGVGMMTSFGDGIRLTPLELTSIIGAVSNGGTMYYLQYPKSQTDIQHFVPRVRRALDIGPLTTEIKPGMLGAVEYGTARRANFNPSEPIFGKTGTCTDTAQPGVHLGWFGSYKEVGTAKIAVTVLLTGGRGISGPIASGVAGNVYHNLASAHYFGSEDPGQMSLPGTLVSLQNSLR